MFRATTRLSWLVGFLCVAGVSAQTWVRRTSPINPPARYQHAMAYDSDRHVVVLFGGRDPTGLNDTWEWDGTLWTPKFPASSPQTPVSGSNYDAVFAMAYDKQRQRTVLYIGPPSTPETWEWDGTTWKKKAPATLPPRRWTATMEYDEARQKVVLYGGIDLNQTAVRNDTWDWDGTDWTLASPAVRPPARGRHAMAYDGGRSAVAVFGGGQASVSQNYPDLWFYDGTDWVESPATGPTHTFESAMAYDPVQGGLVVFGGMDLSDPNPVTQLSNRTWMLLNDTWVQVTGTSPSRRAMHRMVYDSARQKIVLFGGFNGSAMGDTWELDVTTSGPASSVSFFGSGCAGTRGTPFLSVHAGVVPQAGQTFSLQMNNLPLTGSTWMALGFSNATYGTLPLPFDLGPIGAPGCAILTSTDVLLPTVNVLGTSLWQFDLPLSTAGQTIYNQGVVFDPGANALGITLTDGAVVTVGS